MASHSRFRGVVCAIAPLLVLYLFYTLVRWTVADRAASVGDHNARSVLDWERALGIDWETWVQSKILPHEWLIAAVNHYYVFAFFPVLIAAAIAGALLAPAAFHTGRRVFALSLGLALIGFAAFPLTPPRLLGAEYGYVDTLMTNGPRYYGDESGASIFNAYGSIPSMVNEYAAMPSMHVGWTAIAGIVLFIALGRRWWVGALAIAHVLLMQFAVVATGNHYIVDGLVGLFVVAVAYGGVHLFSRSAVPALNGQADRAKALRA